jgi:Ohr subfamily peroxiredoxin
MHVLYTAEALAPGDGRDGHVRTTDGEIDLQLSVPKELGGMGQSANPEHMFAAGYAACFHSALRLVGKQAKADVDDSAVSSLLPQPHATLVGPTFEAWLDSDDADPAT